MIPVIIAGIVSTLTGFGSGVATFLNDFINELIFDIGADGAVTLTGFASWSIAFMGLSLVIGLGALIVNLCRKK